MTGRGFGNVSVPFFIKSRKTTRLSALVLAACLLLSALLATGPVAYAEPASAPAANRSLSSGVCDALWIFSHRVSESGQDILTEKALEESRRSDAEAERQLLSTLNEEGALYAEEVAASRAAQEAAAKEIIRAADDAEHAIVGSSVPKSEAPPAAKPAPANLLCFLGEEVPFQQGGPADIAAPNGYASTWVGTGRVTDNANTYFIGHNPGVFARVMDLELGDKITVFDDTGASRTYHVFDTLILPNGSNYFVYEGRIAPMGETITLQTCCADNRHVRCVMAR